MEQAYNFIIRAVETAPIGVLVIPMGLALMLLFAEQARSQPRTKMLWAIGAYTGICVLLALVGISYNWVVAKSKERAVIAYAVDALNGDYEYTKGFFGTRKAALMRSGINSTSMENIDNWVEELRIKLCSQDSALATMIAALDGEVVPAKNCSRYSSARPRIP